MMRQGLRQVNGTRGGGGPYDRPRVDRRTPLRLGLEGYSKIDGFLVSESSISREQFLRLRALIEPDPDDLWMLLCHPVPADKWAAVGRILRCGAPDPDLDHLTSARALG